MTYDRTFYNSKISPRTRHQMRRHKCSDEASFLRLKQHTLANFILTQVNKMSHFTDLSKVDQVSSMVRRMEKEIEECSDQAVLFNSREQ